MISESEHCGEIPARVLPENKKPDSRVARAPQLNSNLVWSAPRETIENVNCSRSLYVMLSLLRSEMKIKGRDSSQNKNFKRKDMTDWLTRNRQRNANGLPALVDIDVSQTSNYAERIRLDFS